MALEPRFEPLWAEDVRLGAALSLQTLPRHATVICELAESQPELTVVIDYRVPGAFADPAAPGAVRDLGGRPSVWYKLLALGLDSKEEWPHPDLWPLYREAVAAFGPRRLVYGSNLPHVYHRMTYEQGVRWLHELPFVDDAARAAIADTSARRLWRL